MTAGYAATLLAVAVAAAAPSPNASPVASQTSDPLPAPTPLPGAASPTAEPTAAPSITGPPPMPFGLPPVGPAPGGPSPTPVPTPVYHFVFRPVLGAGGASPAPSLPQIAEIDVNEANLAAPGPLDVRVLASPSVTRVVAQALGRSIAIPTYAPGEFRLDGEIPNVPFFFHGHTFEIEFIASAADGATSSVELPFTLR